MASYATALGRFDFKWSVLLAIVVVDTVWMLANGWSLQQASLIGPVFLASVFAAPLAIKRYRDDELIFILCEAIIFSLILALAAVVLSYLAISANFPLIDRTLAKVDEFLGFNWANYYRWSVAHETFQRLIVAAYESLAKQSWLVVFYLCVTRRMARVREFLELSAALFAISILLSMFVPAAGAPKFYASLVKADLSGWSHFEMLRSGSMNLIDLGSMQGLVSIPSVHTVMAILLCWAVRKTPMAFLIIPLNIAVLLSTPVVGGHYITDVLAGAILTMAAIAFRRRILQRYATAAAGVAIPLQVEQPGFTKARL